MNVMLEYIIVFVGVLVINIFVSKEIEKEYVLVLFLSQAVNGLTFVF